MKTALRQWPVRRDHQRGFSLVELMVALTVGLILLGAVLAIFIANRGIYSSNKAVAQIQEDGRFALSFLQNDVRMAGYMGCAQDTQLNSILNVAANDYIYDFSEGITGYEATNTGTGATYVLPATLAVATPSSFDAEADPYVPALSGSEVPFTVTGVGEPLQGSDLLVLRYADSTPANVTQVPSSQSANFKFSVSTLPGFIQPGQIGIITDCVKATVFQVTNTNGYVVVHNSGTGTPGNSTHVLGPQYGPGAELVVPDMMIYYIGLGVDGQPALFKADLNTISSPGTLTLTPEELVANVENMQILYGVDTTGSGTPNAYVTANQVAGWSGNHSQGEVVSVSIALLLQSNTGEAQIPPTPQSFDMLGLTVQAPRDTRLRRVFTTSIGLRNRLP
ncbi:MAG: PilW family protein [Acidiferrobacterales bacterium]